LVLKGKRTNLISTPPAKTRLNCILASQESDSGRQTLFSAIYIHLPSSLLHSYAGRRHPRGPKTARQGKWYAVIYLTIDKPEKQRNGKIQFSAELY